MKKTILLSLVLTLSIYAQEIGTGLAIKVSDGDTVTLAKFPTEEKIKCRLYGIDAPEKDQPYGQDSKRYLQQLVMNRPIAYTIINKDMYGRSVCVLTITENQELININDKMVSSGMAWTYTQFLKKDKETAERLKSLENTAKQEKIGLWQDKLPEAPWQFRKSKKLRKQELDK